MAKLTKGSTFKSFNVNNHVKKEPSLNVERSNMCMNCGNPFTAGYLNFCPAREVNCQICNYEGYFAKLFKSKTKRPSVNIVNDSVHTENCKYVQSEDSWSSKEEKCGVINAWNQSCQSDDDDYSVLSVRTKFN